MIEGECYVCLPCYARYWLLHESISEAAGNAGLSFFSMLQKTRPLVNATAVFVMHNVA